jgi:hypothetical protein
LTYASETWVLTKENERALNIWEINMMSMIYDPINEGGQWRIRTNAELEELYGEQDLVALIKKGSLRWLGHVERMEECCMEDQEDERSPRLRWLDDMEEDLKDTGMRRWRTNTVERNEWQSILEVGLGPSGAVAPMSVSEWTQTSDGLVHRHFCKRVEPD